MFRRRDWITLGLLVLAQGGLVIGYWCVQQTPIPSKLAAGVVQLEKHIVVPSGQTAGVETSPAPEHPTTQEPLPEGPGPVLPAGFQLTPASEPKAAITLEPSPPLVGDGPKVAMNPAVDAIAPGELSPVEPAPAPKSTKDTDSIIKKMAAALFASKDDTKPEVAPPAPTVPTGPPVAPSAGAVTLPEVIPSVVPDKGVPAVDPPPVTPLVQAVTPPADLTPPTPISPPAPFVPSVPTPKPTVHDKSPGIALVPLDVPPPTPAPVESVKPPTPAPTVPHQNPPELPPSKSHEPKPQLIPVTESTTNAPLAPAKAGTPGMPPSACKQTGPPAKVVPCPWQFQVAIIDQRTVLTAKTDKGALFEIRCDTLNLSRPVGTVEASGKVQIKGKDLDGSCDRVVITWSEDRLLLDGNAHLKRLANGEVLELNGPQIQFHLSNAPAKTDWLQGINFRDY